MEKGGGGVKNTPGLRKKMGSGRAARCEGWRNLEESRVDGTERVEQVDSKISLKRNVSSIQHFDKGIESIRFVLFKDYSSLKNNI